jgi:hypothetical protein
VANPQLALVPPRAGHRTAAAHLSADVGPRPIAPELNDFIGLLAEGVGRRGARPGPSPIPEHDELLRSKASAGNFYRSQGEPVFGHLDWLKFGAGRLHPSMRLSGRQGRAKTPSVIEKKESPSCETRALVRIILGGVQGGLLTRTPASMLLVGLRSQRLDDLSRCE